MKAVIKAFHSPDVHDVATWHSDGTDFCVLVQFLIGPDDSLGEESFDVIVCTPGWLAADAVGGGILDGRHTYIVNAWNWPRISAYFRTRVATVSADAWDELAVKLARIGLWELEDYRGAEPGAFHFGNG